MQCASQAECDRVNAAQFVKIFLIFEAAVRLVGPARAYFTAATTKTSQRLKDDLDKLIIRELSEVAMNNLVHQASHPGTEPFSNARLRGDNQRFQGSGGGSPNNRAKSFRPAFLDSATGRVYPSRFANGTFAPVHLLDGLPEEVVQQRDTSGTIIAVKETVFAGFIRGQQFYTREQAAAAVAGQ